MSAADAVLARRVVLMVREVFVVVVFVVVVVAVAVVAVVLGAVKAELSGPPA